MPNNQRQVVDMSALDSIYGQQEEDQVVDLSALDNLPQPQSQGEEESGGYESRLLGDTSAWRQHVPDDPNEVGHARAYGLGVYEDTRILGDPLYAAGNMLSNWINSAEEKFADLTGRERTIDGQPLEDVRADYYDPTGGIKYDDLSASEKALYRGGQTTGIGATATLAGTSAISQGVKMLRGPGASLMSKIFARGGPKSGTVAGHTQRVGEGISQTGRAMTAQLADEPLKFGLMEIGGVTGASYGSAIMQGLMPESEGGRMFGEITGALVGPPSVAARIATKVGGEGGAIRGLLTFSRAHKQEAKLAKMLQKAFADTGEDPEQVIASLRRADELTEGLPVGLRTGSETLTQFENRVAKQNAEFGRERKSAVKDFFKNVGQTVDALIKTGDPQQLRQASKIARAQYDELMESDLIHAQRRAAEAVSKIGPADREAASEEVAKIIRFTYDNARTTERKLWDNVPKNIEVDDADIVRSEVNRLRDELVPGESLPAAEGIQQWVLEPDGPITTGKLLKLRSKLLSEARRLRRGENADPQAARRAERIGGAIQDQLDTIGAENWATNPNVVHAKSFSSALNDVYRRSFARFATQTRGQGEEAVAPGELLEKAFGATGTGAGGRLKAARTFEELEMAGGVSSPEAAQRGNYFDLSVLGPEIRSREEQYLRGVVGQFTDEVEGQPVVNPSKLKNFVSNNEELLNRFPDLRADLQNVETAQAAVRDVMAENKATKTLIDEMAFSKLVGDAVPETVLTNTLFRQNADVEKKFKDLVMVARKSGKAAKDGLSSATLKAVMNEASTADGVSWQRFREALEAPVSMGQKSPLDLLQENQVMTKPEIDRIRTLAERGARIERQLTDPRMVQELVQEDDFLSDLVLRIHGAFIGSEIAQRLPGAGQGRGLVISGATSRFGQNVFQKMPIKRVQDLAVRAVKDPEFMEMLLKKGVNDAQRRKAVQRQLNAYLVASGYSALTEDSDQVRPWENPEAYEDIPEIWE